MLYPIHTHLLLIHVHVVFFSVTGTVQWLVIYSVQPSLDPRTIKILIGVDSRLASSHISKREHLSLNPDLCNAKPWSSIGSEVNHVTVHVEAPFSWESTRCCRLGDN